MYSATLNHDSPRYKDWLSILGCDRVPLQSARSFVMELPPCFGSVVPQKCEAYKLDIPRFGAQQKKSLVEWISQKYGSPVSSILHELDNRGFPILAKDVIVGRRP